MSDFAEYLRKNTNIREGTVRLYDRTIKRFLKRGVELSQESVNAFISESFRESNSFYVKYAFKHYFVFVKKPKLYESLVRVKLKPRKKGGHHYSAVVIENLIEAIKSEKSKDMGILQYAMGCRARGLITLKAEKIDFEYGDSMIRVVLEEKGGREKVSFLDVKFKPLLEKYIVPGKTFLFLSKSAQDMDEERFEMAVNSARSYYYEDLKKAVKELGLSGFGTHDFRRNVADELRRVHKDPYLVKKVLGHARIETTLRYFGESEEDVQDALIERQKARK